MMYRFRRGTTAQNDALIEKAGIITIDTEKEQLRIHDGVTKGGKVIPNLDDVARLERIIDNLSAGAPVFEFLGDIYRIEGGTKASANLSCDGDHPQGTTSVSISDVDNLPGLSKNIVLRNVTDGDEVVIQGVEEGVLTVTPTNKPWTGGAELTTLSETDDPARNAVIIDITDHVPEGVNISALIAHIPVREKGDMTTVPVIRVGPVGEVADYTKTVASFTQVQGNWSIANVIIPVKNNRLAVCVYPAGEDFSGHIRVQGYYAAI